MFGQKNIKLDKQERIGWHDGKKIIRKPINMCYPISWEEEGALQISSTTNCSKQFDHSTT